jgi:hypothetical protein
MNDFKEFIAIIAASILVLVIMVSTLMAVFYPFERSGCLENARSFDRVEYTAFGGCMVEYNGEMLPLKNIKIDYNKELK